MYLNTHAKKIYVPRDYLLLDNPKRARRSLLRRSLTWLISLAMIFVLAIFFAEFANAQDHPIEANTNDLNTMSLNDAESGQLMFAASSGGYIQAVHVNTDVEIEISGMIARVEYRQTFRNDSDDWQEAIYVFPLAENAAVNHMEMIIGDRRILSHIKEREEAKRIYTEAKNSGKRAALTEQQRPNLFTQRVANIGPGEEISIELHFVQRLNYREGIFDFHLPTTLTPRFIPSESTASIEQEKRFRGAGSGWGIPTDEVPDAQEITPPMIPSSASALINPISLSIALEAGLPLAEINSPYHDIRQSKNGDAYGIELAQGQTSMDRDFRLEWRPVASGMPEAALFSEKIDGENYLLLMLLPPQITSTEARLPREMVFIIDTSGSMQGTSIVQARNSLLMALDRLQPQDRFNLIEFNSSHHVLFSGAQAASPANIQVAKNFVRNLNADGGTHMQPALNIALQGDTPEGYLKQVVFITDGAVGNEAALFSLIENKLGDTRLFTVGIGSAPNSFFMSKAAQFGRGSFTYIGDTAEVQERMGALFRQLESPMLSDLQIQWPTSVEQYPERAPDLYAGVPLVISARVEELTGEVVITGKTADQAWRRAIEISPSNNSANAGVGTLWGRAKIESLMDEIVRGEDEQRIRQQVLDVAIPHRLISKYTSLVAVEERIARKNTALTTSAVPNAVAQGQVQQIGTYPRTATWMPFNIFIGCISLIAWLLAKFRQKLDVRLSVAQPCA